MAEFPESPITLANERMSIIDACNEVGLDVSDFSISSLKTYCPFGHLYHADEGRSKALRIYPGTNSAWCFDCNQYYTPVKLLAMDKGVSEHDAALSILEKTNYVAPDYTSRWQALTAPAEEVIDTDALAEALKTYCARVSPDWEELQFEKEVSDKLGMCLGLLPKVKTTEGAVKWLSMTKLAMSQTIGLDMLKTP